MKIKKPSLKGMKNTEYLGRFQKDEFLQQGHNFIGSKMRAALAAAAGDQAGKMQNPMMAQPQPGAVPTQAGAVPVSGPKGAMLGAIGSAIGAAGQAPMSARGGGMFGRIGAALAGRQAGPSQPAGGRMSLIARALAGRKK